jgi:hypothetical protein
MMTRPSSHGHETYAQRKSTLYCWECDHASPVDGDWIRNSRDGALSYVCPVCETTITERSVEDGRDSEPRPAAAWSRVVQTTITAWQASVAAGLAAGTVSASDRHRKR